MSPPEELTLLYSQWRELTEQESAAIRRSAWLELAQYQASKSRLQPRIVEVSAQIDVAALELQFRRVVDALVDLEHRNAEELGRLVNEAREEIGAIDRSARSLRQLQRLYVPPARQNWQSYS